LSERASLPWREGFEGGGLIEQGHVSRRARRGRREDRMYSGSAGQIKPLKVCFARPTFKNYISGKCRLTAQDAKLQRRAKNDYSIALSRKIPIKTKMLLIFFGRAG
jgi:hypothetical protein